MGSDRTMSNHRRPHSDWKVLITGANGFIGGSLANAWVCDGARVVGLCRRSAAASGLDPRIEMQTSSFTLDELAAELRRIEPDVLFHAAGTASVAESLENPNKDFAATVALFQTVLEATRRSGTRPVVVYPSSAAVYGNPEILPVSENAAVRPLSPYGYHKAMAELLAQEYAACFDIPVLVVRLFSVFGARQRRLLVWELFRKLREEAEVEVQGTGQEIRDFLAVEDVATAVAALARAVSSTRGCTIANVASGRGTSVRDMAELMRRLTGSEKRIAYANQRRPGDPDRWIADIARLDRLGGVPAGSERYDLEGRLAATVRAWAAS
jgi:UDP-glucose 4-epimerase